MGREGGGDLLVPHLAEETCLRLLIVEAVASGLRRRVVGALGCH